jgi:prevent-host-death family protein
MKKVSINPMAQIAPSPPAQKLRVSERLPEWQLQQAKNRLSSVVKAAAQGQPQMVTVHGQAAAVVLSPQQYVALLEAQLPPGRLSEELACPVLTDEELGGFERDRSSNPHRELAL